VNVHSSYCRSNQIRCEIDNLDFRKNINTIFSINVNHCIWNNIADSRREYNLKKISVSVHIFHTDETFFIVNKIVTIKLYCSSLIFQKFIQFNKHLKPLKKNRLWDFTIISKSIMNRSTKILIYTKILKLPNDWRRIRNNYM